MKKLTNDHKRALVEILMCASDNNQLGITFVADRLGMPERVAREASNLRLKAHYDAQNNDQPYSYDQTCVEAAYRLIEGDSELTTEYLTPKFT